MFGYDDRLKDDQIAAIRDAAFRAVDELGPDAPWVDLQDAALADVRVQDHLIDEAMAVADRCIDAAIEDLEEVVDDDDGYHQRFAKGPSYARGGREDFHSDG